MMSPGISLWNFIRGIPSEKGRISMKHLMKKLAACILSAVFVLAVPTAAHASETLSYTETERQMLGYIVQQEAGGYDLAHKQVIAQVVINRVRSSEFPDSITGVLTQKNQFSSLSNWYSRRNAPDADTIQAVDDVLSGEYEDETMGATFFYAPRWAGKRAARWFENSLLFLFAIDGHRFFKS